MENKLKALEGNWYGKLKDIFAELNEMGVDFYEVNSEYITAGYNDGDEAVRLLIRLGGTPNTIIINSVEEVYRG
ncbi:MAG: hypothetical protein IJX94_01515 [Clostridia bacterium]|nr:hypothetical protein [Clostridia bacterium]